MLFIHPLLAEILDDKTGDLIGLEKTSEKIQRLFKQHPEINIEQLASTIGVSTRPIERNIKSLKELDCFTVLVRIGVESGGCGMVEFGKSPQYSEAAI